MTELPGPESSQMLLDNITIVLLSPKYPENVGAAARIAKNMGITKLVLVRDEEPDRDKMLKTATHEAAYLIDTMVMHKELSTALAPFTFTIGTTARQGRNRRSDNTPRRMAERLLPLLKNNQIALLFGPEHRGLTNDDLKSCQHTVTIPTADFSSLNLAQAVAILCYEIYYCITGTNRNLASSPKLAESYELEGMYDHIEQLMTTIEFLKTEDTFHWMRNIRQLLGRVGLRSKESRIIRGFCRQFLWYEEKKQANDTLKKSA